MEAYENRRERTTEVFLARLNIYCSLVRLYVGSDIPFEIEYAVHFDMHNNHELMSIRAYRELLYKLGAEYIEHNFAEEQIKSIVITTLEGLSKLKYLLGMTVDAAKLWLELQ